MSKRLSALSSLQRPVDEAISAADAKAGLLALAGDHRRAYPSAMRVIDDHVGQLVAHLRFALEHRKRTRSPNLLERTFVEVRRRARQSTSRPRRH